VLVLNTYVEDTEIRPETLMVGARTSPDVAAKIKFPLVSGILTPLFFM
jgi:hypothetical protein